MYKDKTVGFYVIDPKRIGTAVDGGDKLNNDERLLIACLSDQIISKSPDQQFPWPHDGPVNVTDIIRMSENRALIVFETERVEEMRHIVEPQEEEDVELDPSTLGLETVPDEVPKVAAASTTRTGDTSEWMTSRPSDRPAKKGPANK